MSLRLGTTVIAGTPANDGLSITKNTSNELQAVGVINQSNTSSAVKVWTGTKAEYDLLTPDSNTVYNITDEEAGVSVKSFNLLDFKWVDHLLNDENWLRADTFSWQDGTVYNEAYMHIYNDYQNGVNKSEMVGGYTISYREAPDGHRITTDESSVLSIYNATGVAWYYVLDTENTQFKLPRTKYGFTGLRDTVGKYVPETLPNITGRAGEGSRIYGNDVSGALYITGQYSNAPASGNYVAYNTLNIDASRSSSTYQNNAPVQQRATQMYLYFYVGQFSQSATEQTAGLNSELFNGKVDLNAANLSTQGKSLISGLCMPSGRYIDLSLGATGTQYTAPANGLVYISKTSGASGNFIYLHRDGSNRYGSFSQALGTGMWIDLFLLVKKGDVFAVDYDATGTTNFFRFYYAEGEV